MQLYICRILNFFSPHLTFEGRFLAMPGLAGTCSWPIIDQYLQLPCHWWCLADTRKEMGLAVPPPSTMELKWHPLKKTERWQVSCKWYQKMESSLFKRIFSNAYSEFLESINIFRNSSVVKVLKFNFFCFQKGQILQLKFFIMEWTPTNLKFSVLTKQPLFVPRKNQPLLETVQHVHWNFVK